jgi:hypothetical protein
MDSESDSLCTSTHFARTLTVTVADVQLEVAKMLDPSGCQCSTWTKEFADLFVSIQPNRISKGNPHRVLRNKLSRHANTPSLPCPMGGGSYDTVS